MQVTIWHNPRCSKSREALALLRGRGIEPTIVEYLKAPPDRAEIARVLGLLAIAPRDLMRRGEPAYKARNLADPSLGDDALIDALAAEPVLIERPVVLAGGRAALGRPPEKVLEIL